jgi:hypothetical protein
MKDRISLDALVQEISLAIAKHDTVTAHDASDPMDMTILATLHKIGQPTESLPGVRPHILSMVHAEKIRVISTRGELPPVDVHDVGPHNLSKWLISDEDANAVRHSLGVPAQAEKHDKSEATSDRLLLSAFAESVNNGKAIDWRYWVHQLPALTAGEAARLMCGLDPDLFLNLESRPNKNDQTQLCKKASMIQRLAEREGKVSATPSEWITWAGGHQIAVHDGFRLEVESAPAMTTAMPAPVLPACASDGVEELDYSLLATPAELLDAFGKWGMDAAWFDDLNSRQWLLDARRRKGQGQRGHVIEPLFCPFAVMNGLIGKVRKAKRLQPDTAWRTLEHKFPKVHATFESHDPRDRTGD